MAKKKETKEQRSISLPKTMWRNIEKKSEEEKRSLNTMIEWAFEQYLKSNPVNEK